MKKLIILLGFLATTFSVNARHKPGYVVMQNNDTIHGIINVFPTNVGLTEVIFKRDSTSQFTLYKPKELIGFTFENQVFESIKVPNKSNQFLRVVAKGAVSLYKLYYKDVDEKHNPIIKMSYYINYNGKTKQLLEFPWFEKQAKKAFKLNPNLIKSIKKNDLKSNQIELIVQYYNQFLKNKIVSTYLNDEATLNEPGWQKRFEEMNLSPQVETNVDEERKKTPDYIVVINDTIYGELRWKFITQSGNKIKLDPYVISSYKDDSTFYESLLCKPHSLFEGLKKVFMIRIIEGPISLYYYTDYSGTSGFKGGGGSVTEHYYKVSGKTFLVEKKYSNFLDQASEIFQNNNDLIQKIKNKEYKPYRYDGKDLKKVVELQNEFLKNQNPSVTQKKEIGETFERECDSFNH